MMPAPRSLQARLTVAIASVLGLTLLAFSGLLYAGVHAALYRHFDMHLVEDARAIANMVEERAEGQWQFETGAAEYLTRRHGGLHFAVHMDDGTLLASSSRGGVSGLLPSTLRCGTPQPTTFDSGDAARALRIQLAPRQDEHGPSHPSGRLVRVEVVRATHGIDEILHSLRLTLVAGLATTLLLATLVAVTAIRRGLAPIARVSARADTIDSRHLDYRLPSADLPRELRPVVLKLNELLARLHTAFERERQFTSDASHELRTPLAGLRSILEVSASRERSSSEHRSAIGQALKVVGQMHDLVEQLLLLSRLDEKARSEQRQSIEVAALVDTCFEPFRSAAAARGLTLDNRIAATERVVADRNALGLVFTNLLRNAVQYADEGSVIVAESEGHGEILSLTNRGRPIPDHALTSVFERFVRLDGSRENEDGTHFGIGLALVRKLCDQLAMQVAAKNRGDGQVCFVVSSSVNDEPPA